MRRVIVGILLFIAFSQPARALDKDAVFEVRVANATLMKLLEEKKHKEGVELALKTLKQAEKKKLARDISLRCPLDFIWLPFMKDWNDIRKLNKS